MLSWPVDPALSSIPPPKKTRTLTTKLHLASPTSKKTMTLLKYTRDPIFSKIISQNTNDKPENWYHEKSQPQPKKQYFFCKLSNKVPTLKKSIITTHTIKEVRIYQYKRKSKTVLQLKFLFLAIRNKKMCFSMKIKYSIISKLQITSLDTHFCSHHWFVIVWTPF